MWLVIQGSCLVVSSTLWSLNEVASGPSSWHRKHKKGSGKQSLAQVPAQNGLPVPLAIPFPHFSTSYSHFLSIEPGQGDQTANGTYTSELDTFLCQL